MSDPDMAGPLFYRKFEMQGFRQVELSLDGGATLATANGRDSVHTSNLLNQYTQHTVPVDNGSAP